MRLPSISARFPRLTSALFASQLEAAGSSPFLLICGLNTLKAPQETLSLASEIASAARTLSIPTVFKASFDKANRTHVDSARGPGLHDGLEILRNVRSETGLPVLTDVHETSQIPLAAAAVDALQIPAFLCRQTDLIWTAAETSLPINLKKGQFASAAVMVSAAEKARRANPAANILITERGTTFGHSGLVVDFAELGKLREAHAPVVLDATHAAQTPPAANLHSTMGDLRAVHTLARAGAAAGVDGIFLEVDEGHGIGPCDPQVQMPIRDLTPFLEELLLLSAASREKRTWERDAENPEAS